MPCVAQQPIEEQARKEEREREREREKETQRDGDEERGKTIELGQSRYVTSSSRSLAREHLGEWIG